MTTVVLVCPRHAQKLGYCSKGVRMYFEKHNLDYTDYVLNGIDAEKLLAISGPTDEMTLRIVEEARGK